MYDVIIIGTGAAGVSAALTLKARSKSILWLGNKNLSRKISSAEKIINYPGLNAVCGREMQSAFLAQIASSKLTITQKQATGVYESGGYFTVLCGQDVFEGKAVILATGVDGVKPIDGERELLGRGISYCATCDGFLYKGKTIAVVCTSEEYEEEIEYLARIVKKLYLVPLYANASVKGDNIEYIRDMPVAIEGKQRVGQLIFKDRAVAVDGVFMLKSAVAPTTLVPGVATEDGHVAVDRAQRTSITGLFAAGDCTGRPYQYAKAVGEGNVAAHSACEFLAAEK